MARSRPTLAGGALATVGGIGHLVTSWRMRDDVWGAAFDDGLLNTVSLDPSPEQLAYAEAFWFSPGSFGAPLAILGGLVIRLERQGARVPGSVGWGLTAWAALLGVLGGFDVGTALLALTGVLIGIGGLASRATRSAAPEGSG
jgi:hypothetical protein